MKDCRNCKHATLLEGRLEGWVSCREFLEEDFDLVHSPSFAEYMCNKFEQHENNI